MRFAFRKAISQSGLTLVELMVTLGVSSIVMLGLNDFLLISKKSEKTSETIEQFNALRGIIQTALQNPKVCKQIIGSSLNGKFSSSGTPIATLKQGGITLAQKGQITGGFEILDMSLQAVAGPNPVMVTVGGNPVNWREYVASFRISVKKTGTSKQIFAPDMQLTKDFYFSLYTNSSRVFQDCARPSGPPTYYSTCDNASPSGTSSDWNGTSGTHFQCIAQCPTDYYLASGGCATTIPYWHVVASYPSGNTWVCRVKDDDAVPDGVPNASGYAICVK